MVRGTNRQNKGLAEVRCADEKLMVGWDSKPGCSQDTYSVRTKPGVVSKAVTVWGLVDPDNRS